MDELAAAVALYADRALLLSGKRPITRGWQRGQTARQRAALLARDPDLNVGVLTGDGLVVVDEDPRNGGSESRLALESAHGPLPDTYRVLTGGSGTHYYFWWPLPLPSFLLAPGLEVKAAGSQVVAPPSVHPRTRRIYVADPSGPTFGAFADLPGWIVGRAVPARPTWSGEQSRQGRRDPLMRIPAADYVTVFTGRTAGPNGRVRCPFHKNGLEEHPDLVISGHLWCCWGCPPPPGARVFGGNIYTFAAALWGCVLPLRGPAFASVAERVSERMVEYLSGEDAA